MNPTRSLKSASDLATHALIPESEVAELSDVAARYSVSLTTIVAREVRRRGRDSAIGRQFVPNVDELTTTAIDLADPIGDETHSPVPGVVHRYPDRLLLKLLTVCSVYCRFCFRRETVGAP